VPARPVRRNMDKDSESNTRRDTCLDEFLSWRELQRILLINATCEALNWSGSLPSLICFRRSTFTIFAMMAFRILSSLASSATGGATGVSRRIQLVWTCYALLSTEVPWVADQKREERGGGASPASELAVWETSVTNARYSGTKARGHCPRSEIGPRL
jgi:hypothetical protein